MRASVKAIEHFESATALVVRVTLHYWLGGDPTGLQSCSGTAFSERAIRGISNAAPGRSWIQGAPCLICVAMAIQISPRELKGMTVARSRRTFVADSYTSALVRAVRLRSPLMTWAHRRRCSGLPLKVSQ